MDYIRDMIKRQKAGILCGIPSFCTSNELAIEACIDSAMRCNLPVLIEATANQVNQFGGYTGMKPADFRDYVYKIADRIGFSRERIILGGDHLGPLTWSDLDEKEAMANSEELVRLFVLAGFAKIHLDTSMRLADDSRDGRFPDEIIAARGVRLYKACEQAYAELLKTRPDAVHPVYVIGSEVPIPGGAQEVESSISVTPPGNLYATLKAYRAAFEQEGIFDAFDNIVGVVVQPGVEFSDDDAFVYNRQNARELVSFAKKLPGIVLEGHSTDYQSAEALREMCEDGISILKVGPAITFGIREGLYALSYMEKILVPESRRANFMETLEGAMVAAPASWKKHYKGSDAEIAVKRMFSYSDRCRYYLARPEVARAIDRLLENMSGVDIPMGMLHQFMPVQYYKVRDGKLRCVPKELVKDFAGRFAEDYFYAVGAMS